ncbi:uncharacterized protein C19orf44 homolog [Choloepus didactylus]|uniref:uncharacterized protein C19orf44 homolog n=1 Tax=Choloepus didactylus TaxID=27675 RepID=UPI0018A0B561|nr:uncharacterized protein C19orf44 homolog [Choloepus didactylus]
MAGQRGWRTRKASRPGHDLFRNFSDFSDFSSEDSRLEEIRNAGISRRLLSTTPGPSRFLKRNQTRARNRSLPGESPVLGSRPGLSSGWPPTPASKIRAEAVLTRLARIESKILGRRTHMDLSASDSGPETPEASPPGAADETPRSSTGDVPSQKQAWELPVPKSRGPDGKGSRFLKKKETPVANISPTTHFEKERNFPLPKQKEPTRTFDSPDSDEEEMKVLLGSLMESSREKEADTNQREREQTERFLKEEPVAAQPSVVSLPSEELSSPRPFRTPHPAALPSADGTLGGAGSRTPSPSTHSFNGSASVVGAWSTQGRATPVSSPGLSDSLNDFRVNLFSLEDLHPATGENSEPEQQEEIARQGKPAHPGSREEAPARPGVPGQAQAASSEVAAKAASPASERGPPTESDVSELLSGQTASFSQGSTSSRRAASGDPMASTASSAYSEDFEGSQSPTASEPVGHSEAPPDRALEAWSEFSSSLKRDLPALPPQRSRKWGPEVTRVIVKETAVQTLDPAFSYQWTSAAGVAALGPGLGGTYVDPTPIASHVISADAIEALTAYSPAALALNELLRQQLSLTQGFVEASRQLHGSVLRALDEDAFHYHTLEEAKEYIRRHRPAALTLEDALEQVREEP